MLQDLFNLLFPKNCLGCNSILLNASHFICVSCLHAIDFTSVGQNSNPTIMSRFYGKLRLQNANALIYYDKTEISHRLIHELKYKNQQQIGIFFADLIFEKYHKTFKNIDELVAVPLHPKKEIKRGYNQLDTFGKRLAELTNIPYNKKRLTRNFYSNSQTTKNIFARSDMQKNLFTVNFNQDDHGKHFMILDDVVTTGSTLEVLGNELLQIPNSKISLLVMAYTK